MNFIVANSISEITERNVIGLIIDNWNDWYTYKTMYTVIYYDNNGDWNRIGSVKIGEADLSSGRPDIPLRFYSLDKHFFSLGQSDEYYIELDRLGGDVRDEILSALNDIAYDNQIYWLNQNYDVTQNSLMRNIAQTTVLGQFHRLATGKARLSEYNFNYKIESLYEWENDIELHFEVHPNSKPPTNVHVIIGRNGVGKTRLLTNMVKSIICNDGLFYELNSDDEIKDIKKIFAGIVFVSFSAFDYDIPMEGDSKSIKYSYIGLKRRDAASNSLLNKKVEDLTEEFAETLKICFENSKLNLWKYIVKLLNSDPIFKENSISEILEGYSENIPDTVKASAMIEKAKKVFNKLSSGHKIVLLTLSSLVMRVEERTLVLIDEPEVHLHPPLLAAFTRALSELLINRNGVAIIATHSPVVLQEVPQTCVWKLRRYGTNVVVERLQIECFGENLGVLTSEVFRHEVTESGVHKMLLESVEKLDTFEEVMEEFDNQLGFEAQAILRSMLANKNEGSSHE